MQIDGGFLIRIASVVLCFAWVATAHAEPAAASQVEASSPARPARFGFNGELGLTTRSDEASALVVLSPLIGASYRLGASIRFGLEWGLVFATETPRQGVPERTVAVGNPLLALLYRWLDTDTDRLELRAALVPPLAWLPSGVVERGLVRASYAYAAASRGLWNAWLWGAEQVAVVAGASWVRELIPLLRLRLEADVAMSLPLTEITQDLADAYLQLAPSLELHSEPVSLGLRIQAVFMTSSSATRQLSVSPYARVDVNAWSFEARPVINIDGPLGTGGAGLGAWGVLVSVRRNP
jgi:hypothetical protein